MLLSSLRRDSGLTKAMHVTLDLVSILLMHLEADWEGETNKKTPVALYCTMVCVCVSSTSILVVTATHIMYSEPCMLLQEDLPFSKP